jgi:hypothetical protein
MVKMASLPCSFCGKTISKKSSSPKKFNYCNPECQYKHKKELMKGHIISQVSREKISESLKDYWKNEERRIEQSLKLSGDDSFNCFKKPLRCRMAHMRLYLIWRAK